MRKRRVGKQAGREGLIAFAFILLPVLGFLIFTVGAMVFSSKYSFENYNLFTGESTFVGRKNYKDLFTNVLYSTSFKNAIKNTLVLLLGVPISMVPGILSAAFIKSGKIKGGKFFQVLYYLPVVSGAVAMNIVWRYIFNNEFGIINLLVGQKIPWLSDDTLIKVAIIAKNSLNGVGTAMILYLAAMLNISKD